MAVEPTTPARKKRRRIQQKRRIDAGSMRFTARDGDIMRFGAEQTFARADTLGEYLAPGHTPATAEPPASQLADTTAPTKRAWPADSRHRLMAVSKLLKKLATRGYLEVIQPWSDQPAWYRTTALGLRYLGLDWPDIPFERALELALPPREKDTRRPHKADGVIRLEEDGVWEVLSADRTRVQDRVPLKAGQIIGIEIECTLKSDHRLSEILPDLMAHHDFVWYFCLTPAIKQAVADARREALTTDEQRRRVRILLLEEYLPCP